MSLIINPFVTVTIMYYSNLQVNYMPLEPSPEPLLTVVPPEVATVNDLQCEQLAVDPTPTAGVLGDKKRL